MVNTLQGACGGPAPCRAGEREAPDPARARCCVPLNTVSPRAQEFTRCVARAVDPLMAAPGPEPWRDSGLERLYQGLPFWVNATANSTTASPANTASAPSGTPTAQVPCPHVLPYPSSPYNPTPVRAGGPCGKRAVSHARGPALLRQAPDAGRGRQAHCVARTWALHSCAVRLTPAVRAPRQVAQSNSYGNLYGAAPAPAPSGATYYLRRLMA